MFQSPLLPRPVYVATPVVGYVYTPYLPISHLGPHFLTVQFHQIIPESKSDSSKTFVATSTTAAGTPDVVPPVKPLPAPSSPSEAISAGPSTKSTPTQKEDQVELVELSEELIAQMNARSSENDKKIIRQIIDRMKRLGGLDNNSVQSGQDIDIEVAAISFSMLLGLKHQWENKRDALLALELLLKKYKRYDDPNMANITMQLVFKLLDQFKNDVLQTTQTIEMQILVATVMECLIENLREFYTSGFINAITVDLKTQLIHIAEELNKLNRNKGLRSNRVRSSNLDAQQNARYQSLKQRTDNIISNGSDLIDNRVKLDEILEKIRDSVIWLIQQVTANAGSKCTIL